MSEIKPWKASRNRSRNTIPRAETVEVAHAAPEHQRQASDTTEDNTESETGRILTDLEKLPQERSFDGEQEKQARKRGGEDTSSGCLQRQDPQSERSLMGGPNDKLGRMADRMVRFGFLFVLTFVALVLAWYCWTRASIGRFVYHETSDSVTILDTKTGVVYFLVNGVWREVSPQTGQAVDRTYQKIN